MYNTYISATSMCNPQYKTINTCIGEINAVLHDMNQENLQIVLRKFVHKHGVLVHVYAKCGHGKYSSIVYSGNLSTKFITADHIFRRIVEEITNAYAQTKVV